MSPHASPAPMPADVFAAASPSGLPRRPLRDFDYPEGDNEDALRHRKKRDAILRARAKMRRRRRPWLRWAATSAVIIAGLSLYALEHRPPDAQAVPQLVPDVETTASLLSPPPQWQAVVDPAVLFAFDLPELRLPAMTVEARLYQQGGREDALSIGSLTEPFYFRIAIGRTLQPQGVSFYLDLVRSAAYAGLSVRRSAQASGYRTKFGPVETASVTLARGETAECLAFRGTVVEGAASLHGWICGEAQFVNADMLACFIDRLVPTPALREPALETAMRSANKNRTPACAAAMPRLADAQ